MARPLKGRVILRGSRFQASVPKVKRSTERHYEVFDTKAQADAWCALAVANLQAGIPLPARRAVLGQGDPDIVTANRRAMPLTPLALSISAAEVADDWFHEVYVDGRSAGAERARNVRSILNRRVVPFLSETFVDGHSLTRDKYRTYLAALGRPAAEPIQGKGRRAIHGLSQDALADVRRCLDAVIKHGVNADAWKLEFELSDVRTPRSRRPNSPKAAGLSLADIGRIAEHMHAVHQIPLWTCRILTLRLGEAYGIRVGDIAHLNDGTGRGLLWLHAQGGRKFHAYNGEEVVRSFHKEGMKHGFSERMQLVPAQLMSLYDDVIEVFHTDCSTGQVDLDARFIPGLASQHSGGQETFRAALKMAAQEAGVSTVSLNGFTRTVIGSPNPKDLRSAAVTDLEWVPGLDPTALRRYAGHAPGTDVHALHYVVDQPVNDKSVQICAAMESIIHAELPDGLRVPTSKRCTTGSQRALGPRSREIDEQLMLCGWLLADITELPHSWLSVEEAGEILGQAPTTIRRWVREGRLAASLGKSQGGTHQGHRIRRSAVVDFARYESDRTTLTDLEELLGVSYHRLYSWVRRFALATEPAGERGLYLPSATIGELQRLVDMEHALQRDGVPFAEAATILGVQSRTIHARVQLGTLQELPERGPDGTRYVTRASVRRAVCKPELMSVRRKRRRGR